MKNEICRKFLPLPENESDKFEIHFPEREGETTFLLLPPLSEKAPEGKCFFSLRGSTLIFSSIGSGWFSDFMSDFPSPALAKIFAFEIFDNPEIIEVGDDFDEIYKDWLQICEGETGEDFEEEEEGEGEEVPKKEEKLECIRIELWDGDSFDGIVAMQPWIDSAPGRIKTDPPMVKLRFWDGSKRNLEIDQIQVILPSKLIR